MIMDAPDAGAEANSRSERAGRARRRKPLACGDPPRVGLNSKGPFTLVGVVDRPGQRVTAAIWPRTGGRRRNLPGSAE
jgi:hypothetical protein